MARDKSRRTPKQLRSQATVDAVAAAAASILSSEGYNNLTTNKVAEKADISVGSIYEYFRDKDAIVDLLIERFANTLRSEVAVAFEVAGRLSLVDGLKVVTHSGVKVFRQDPKLSAELLARAPYSKAQAALNQTEYDVSAMMAEFLNEHKEDYKRSDTQVSAAVSIRSGRGLIEASCLDEAFVLNLTNVEPELLSLMEGYLVHFSSNPQS